SRPAARWARPRCGKTAVPRVPPTKPRPLRAKARPEMDRRERWEHFLTDLPRLAANSGPLESQGKLVRVAGLVLEASGVKVPVGSVCEILPPSSGANPQRGKRPVNAEVVGFSGDRAFLMPTDEVAGLASGAGVVPRALPLQKPVLGQPNH